MVTTPYQFAVAVQAWFQLLTPGLQGLLYFPLNGDMMWPLNLMLRSFLEGL